MPVFVHIGLPKTATTFWQRRIFPAVPDIDLMHRQQDDGSATICNDLRHYCHRRQKQRGHAWMAKVTERSRDLAPRIAKAAVEGRKVLISNENISLDPLEFWRDRNPPPKTVAERMLAYLRKVAGIHDEIRVLIGTRSQGEWLASRYSQSRKGFEGKDRADAMEFSQADFNRRLEQLAGSTRLSDSELWLDYAHIEKVFGDVCGRSNLMFLPMERLTTDIDALLGELQDFLQCADLAPIYAAIMQESRGKTRMNRRSTSESTWKFGETDLTLEPQLRARIAQRFARSGA